MHKDECKSIAEWANDPSCPLKKYKLWNEVKAKRIKAFRIAGGRKWYITRADLFAYIHSPSAQGAANG